MHVITVDYQASNAAELFCESLKNTGFGVLSNHPIPVKQINLTYQVWRDFFNSEDKFHYLYQKPAQDGFFPFRTENAKDQKISDLKEFFHFYPWGKIPLPLKEITSQLFLALNGLAAELLQWVENYLPADTAKQLSMPLNQMIMQSKNTLLRILHYPPLDHQFEPGAIRAAPHEDINLITLLPAATSPGLEVKDVYQNWHAITCDPGNIVVNVGDMLALCTKQYYKSTTHRVVNPETIADNCSRYSMPLFLHPREEVKLTADRTAVEFLHERLRAIGIY